MTANAVGSPRPARKRNWTQIARRISQLGFAIFIVVASLRHGLGEASGEVTASTDALCPFGAVETLFSWIATGSLVPKTHPSNLVLGFGLLIGVLLAGSAFCGWVCPFGAYQDAIAWIRRKLHIRPTRLPSRADSLLRYGRYLTLGVILYATISSTKLWFSDYDPYRTLFGLNWLFEFNFATMWPGFLVLGVVSVGSLLIERFWCRYLCPLGGVMSLLGHLSLLRIRRQESSCRSCALCSKPCPVGINVESADPTVNTNCIGCLSCLDTCPRNGALTVQLHPTWIDGAKRLLSHRTACQVVGRDPSGTTPL